MSENQKFALITGCGEGGIGEALAKEYLSRGIQPIATVLPGETSEHLSTVGIDTVDLDVTNEASILALKEYVAKKTDGKLLILVNNAGICYTMTSIDTDVRQVERMFDVNLFGPMRMVHYFHGFLIRAGGTIVNIGSVGGIVPYVYGSSYNASKAALHHWGNTLRVEMAPLGVDVLTVISGEIGTNILKSDRNRDLPKGSFYSPLADEFRAHVNRTPNTTSRFQYARGVVSTSLQHNKPAWFWIGKTSGVVRFMETFGFRRVWDHIFSFMFGLSKLQRVTEKKFH